ncbi:MAG: NADH-quinone oxidoreductase subunit C [Chloroflexota bacterium]|nr:NADH-quinone oxidoreductase subunit C [Chloroflexota bacterium]
MAESYGFGAAGGAEEQVERQLASFAFVREEREREVRLHFRDVPAAELAMSFRRSGAGLISMMGERARLAVPPPAEEDAAASLEDESSAGSVRRRRRSHSGAEAPPPGELTVRYFYSLGDIVYTISIAAPSGVIQSVVNIYPNAALPEHELREHLGVVFQSDE